MNQPFAGAQRQRPSPREAGLTGKQLAHRQGIGRMVNSIPNKCSTTLYGHLTGFARFGIIVG